MKTINEAIDILREREEELKRKYKIKSLKVLDSRTMEFLNYGLEEGEKEEIGIVADFEETPSLLKIVELKLELEEILGIKVGVYTEGGLSSLKIPYNTIEV